MWTFNGIDLRSIKNFLNWTNKLLLGRGILLQEDTSEPMSIPAGASSFAFVCTECSSVRRAGGLLLRIR